jgi:hypothetical protein
MAELALKGVPKKRDPAEEAHWRLDEHERKLEEVKPEKLAAMLQGAVEALHARHQVDTERLISSVKEDVESDRAVVKKLDALTVQLAELCRDLKALVAALSRPTVRSATVDLPSGRATMTVHEKRQDA